MVIEKNNNKSFSLIWLGNELDIVPQIKFTYRFKNIDDFKRSITNNANDSIILILSNGMSLDNTFNELRQICAIFNEQLVCLYCHPTMKLCVDLYMQDKQLQKPKHWFIRL